MNLRSIFYSGASIWFLIQSQIPTIANTMPESIELNDIEEQRRLPFWEGQEFNKGITTLFDEASNEYSLPILNENELNSQYKLFVGQSPVLLKGYMYPEKATFMESRNIRDLYNFLMKSQTSSFNLRVDDPNDVYLYDSSI